MTLLNYVHETLLQNGSGYLMSSLLVDVVCLVVLFYVTSTVVYPAAKSRLSFRKMLKEVGGPKNHWFWGDTKEYGFTNDGLLNSVKRIKDFPAMCSYYVSFFGAVHLYHPDVTKTAMARYIPKSWGYKMFVTPFLRQGLITSDGSMWKRHRRLLNAIFHFDILKEHCRVFNRNSENLLEGLDQIAATGAPGEITNIIGSTNFVNIMECVMSQKDLNDKNNFHFIQDIHEAAFRVVERQQNAFLWLPLIYNQTKQGKKFKKATESIFNRAESVIKERRSLLQSMSESNLKSETNVITDEATGKTFTFRKRKGKTMDFLDLLLQTKDQDGVGLTDDEIKDEVITFFAAGMETVTTGSSWLFYLLAKHPEIQVKCREEIYQKLGDKTDLEASDLSKLSYITQCIKETLRLFPPVHFIAKQLEEDTVFSHRFNNHQPITLKKGTNIGVNVFVLHRNPHVWENPESFDPERFNPDNTTKIPLYSYIPFAAGPRNCIGQHFAMMEMKVFLAKVLTKFELIWNSSNPPVKIKPGATLVPENGLYLTVKRLEQ